MDNVAILIPMYNESKTIENVIKNFNSVLPPNSKIYIYDNNSTDGSYDLVNNMITYPQGSNRGEKNKV